MQLEVIQTERFVFDLNAEETAAVSALPEDERDEWAENYFTNLSAPAADASHYEVPDRTCNLVLDAAEAAAAQTAAFNPVI